MKTQGTGTTHFTIFLVVTNYTWNSQFIPIMIPSMSIPPGRANARNEFSEAWTRAIIAPVPVKDDSRLTAGGPSGANCCRYDWYRFVGNHFIPSFSVFGWSSHNKEALQRPTRSEQ